MKTFAHIPGIFPSTTTDTIAAQVLQLGCRYVKKGELNNGIFMKTLYNKPQEITPSIVSFKRLFSLPIYPSITPIDTIQIFDDSTSTGGLYATG